MFETDDPPPVGLLRAAAECARELLDRYGNPLAPQAVEAYFRLFYWSQQHRWDSGRVLEAFCDELRNPSHLSLLFRTAAEVLPHHP